MKIIKFLLSNFQVLNFFIASLIVGICFGLWYSPKSSESSSSVKLNSPDQENQSSTVNNTKTQLEQSDTGEIQKQSTPIDSTVEVSPTASPQENSIQKNPPTSPTVNKNIPEPSKFPPFPSEYPSPMDENMINPSAQKILAIENYTHLGHFRFAETPSHRRVNVGKYYHRTEYLDQETAKAFAKMKADAKAEGIELVLMSGFRTIATQKKLFDKQIQKRGSKEAAARLSAPPGHSEHHTGYAVDIGDGKQPEADFKFQFESTQAYNWLVNNAYKYGFELSFPRNNLQGVSFEPWHWRYVGSTRAQQIFAIPRMYNQKN